MNDRRIKTIAIVGDGIAGWSVAAALCRRAPKVSVALVPASGARDGLVDHFGGAAPSIGDFHRDIGLSERDVVVRTGAAFRLGTLFAGWAEQDYVHAFDAADSLIAGVPTARLWPRLRGPDPFDAFLPGASLGRAGRFQPAGRGVLSGYAHGLQLETTTYRSFIESYARFLGVVATQGRLAEVNLENGRVTGLCLDDGSRLVADLFVDASGAQARLIGRIDDTWEDWSKVLRCNCATVIDIEPDPSLPPIERIDALADGWRLSAALPDRTRTAVIQTGNPVDGRSIRFRQGRRARAWVGNVVALGEAYGVIEPLEGAPLHLLHTQIDRLVASLPDQDFAAVELRHYNRETGQEADRLRDFLVLHYILSHRDEPFWRAARTATQSALLTDTLAQFGERGRLPIRDGESFGKGSWHSIFYGQGVVPRRGDLLVTRTTLANARHGIAAYRRQLTRAVNAAPTHRDYLAGLRSPA